MLSIDFLSFYSFLRQGVSKDIDATSYLGFFIRILRLRKCFLEAVLGPPLDKLLTTLPLNTSTAECFS